MPKIKTGQTNLTPRDDNETDGSSNLNATSINLNGQHTKTHQLNDVFEDEEPKCKGNDDKKYQNPVKRVLTRSNSEQQEKVENKRK